MLASFNTDLSSSGLRLHVYTYTEVQKQTCKHGEKHIFLYFFRRQLPETSACTSFKNCRQKDYRPAVNSSDESADSLWWRHALPRHISGRANSFGSKTHLKETRFFYSLTMTYFGNFGEMFLWILLIKKSLRMSYGLEYNNAEHEKPCEYDCYSIWIFSLKNINCQDSLLFLTFYH